MKYIVIIFLYLDFFLLKYFQIIALPLYIFQYWKRLMMTETFTNKIKNISPSYS